MKRRNMLVLGGIIIAFMAIIVFTVVSIAGKTKQEGDSVEDVKETLDPEHTKSSRAIIKKIDLENGILTATDTATSIETVYYFTGGTAFTSRYGQEIFAKDMLLGEIVDLTYNDTENKITSCAVADDAWEYTNVSNWTIDKENQTISVGATAFAYGDLFQVFNSKEMIDSNALSPKDLITIKGMKGQAYSVIVVKGHGTFQLANYSDFVGGSIEIGYDVMTKVQEDQVFTLREGDYRVTVKKGTLEAVKYVHVNADEMTTLDLGDTITASSQKGKVKFTVNPNGADLYINNVATEYASDVTLEYGTYKIKVSCNGYETYSEQLTVENETEEVYINLVTSSLSKATVSPTASAGTTESGSSVVTKAPSATRSPGSTTVASPTASPTATPSALVTDSDHTITVNGPSGVKLYINNEYKGALPATITKVIGTNIKCTLKKEGQSDKTYTLNVVDDNNDITWQFSEWW